jgi:hypothetical protein
MAKGLPDDSNKVLVPCLGCGHNTTKTIARLRNNVEFVCDGCGRAILLLQNAQLRTDRKKVDHAVDGVRRSNRAKRC